MRHLTAKEIIVLMCLGGVAGGGVEVARHGFPAGSHSPSTAIYIGAGDGTITSCQARDYTTLRAVDIGWQVTNRDTRPHDYRVFIDAAPGFENEVDVPALAPGWLKADSTTVVVTPAKDGSWPVIKCTITAVAS